MNKDSLEPAHYYVEEEGEDEDGEDSGDEEGENGGLHSVLEVIGEGSSPGIGEG